jgi:translation initiation factor 1 (eIF-1/SUI1)
MLMWKYPKESLGKLLRSTIKTDEMSQAQWLKSGLLATQEVEIKRIVVQGQHVQQVHELLSQQIM